MSDTSTTEGATSNKRRRTDGDTATAAAAGAAFGGSAANAAVPPDLAATLGPKLAPIMGLLALQPGKLKGTIISSSKEMLSLRATIKQRTETHARFSGPLKNATTGEVQRDEAGKDIPFIPTSLRYNCKVKASDKTNDDPAMCKLLGEAAAEHELHIRKMTGYAERVARLEIELRQKELRHKFFGLIERIALSRLVIAGVRTGRNTGEPPEGARLTRNEQAKKICHDVFAAAPPAVGRYLGIAIGDKASEVYAAYAEYDNAEIEKKMLPPLTQESRASSMNDDASVDHTVDERIILPIIAEMIPWTSTLSVGVWKADDDRDKERAIDAALEEVLTPIEMREANEAVEMALDAEDAENPSKGLLDTVRKDTRRAIQKEMAIFKKQLRKNYSGDGGGGQPPSKPTKNGRESKRTSKPPASKTKGKSTTAKQGGKPKATKGGKSKGKKKEDDTADEPKPRPSKKPTRRRANGNRGGPNGGGKNGGAARR